MRFATLVLFLAGCGADSNGGHPGSGAGAAGGTVVGASGGAAVATSGGAPSIASAGASSIGAGGAGTGNGGTSIGSGGTGSGSGGVSGAPPAGGTGATGGDAGAPSGGAAGGGATLTDMETLMPHASWTCGMPEGIPPPTKGELVLEATAQLGQIYDLGETQYGHRFLTEIKGGTVSGPKISGTLMDRGLDYELTLSNGAVELEELNVLKTSDGASIYLRTCGAAPGPSNVVRIVPDFEAPNGGAYAFLNTDPLVGTRELDKSAKTLKFSVYRVTAPAPKDTVAVVEPAGVPDQTWECKKASGTKGAVVYTSSVSIGGSVAVGASKRGTRNIFPITGGTTTGRVAGTILSGGADYQIVGTPMQIDERYTVHTGDGELIIVRNCGPVGALVPVFETRTDGPYAFLNANTWLSGDASVGAGAVSITIYERH